MLHPAHAKGFLIYINVCVRVCVCVDSGMIVKKKEEAEILD